MPNSEKNYEDPQLYKTSKKGIHVCFCLWDVSTTPLPSWTSKWCFSFSIFL